MAFEFKDERAGEAPLIRAGHVLVGKVFTADGSDLYLRCQGGAVRFSGESRPSIYCLAALSEVGDVKVLHDVKITVTATNVSPIDSL